MHLYVLKVSVEKKKRGKKTLGFLLIIFIPESDLRLVNRLYFKEPDCESVWLHFNMKRHITFHYNLKYGRNKLDNITVYQQWHVRGQKKESLWSTDVQSLLALKTSSSTNEYWPGSKSYWLIPSTFILKMTDWVSFTGVLKLAIPEGTCCSVWNTAGHLYWKLQFSRYWFSFSGINSVN